MYGEAFNPLEIPLHVVRAQGRTRGTRSPAELTSSLSVAAWHCEHLQALGRTWEGLESFGKRGSRAGGETGGHLGSRGNRTVGEMLGKMGKAWELVGNSGKRVNRALGKCWERWERLEKCLETLGDVKNLRTHWETLGTLGNAWELLGTFVWRG